MTTVGDVRWVLVLTAFDDDDYVYGALRARVRGFLAGPRPRGLSRRARPSPGRQQILRAVDREAVRVDGHAVDPARERQPGFPTFRHRSRAAVARGTWSAGASSWAPGRAVRRPGCRRGGSNRRGGCGGRRSRSKRPCPGCGAGVRVRARTRASQTASATRRGARTRCGSWPPSPPGPGRLPPRWPGPPGRAEPVPPGDRR